MQISRETTVAEIVAVEGLDEYARRAVGVNITSGFTNAVELAVRVYKAPTFEVLLADFTGAILENEELANWHEEGTTTVEDDEEELIDD